MSDTEPQQDWTVSLLQVSALNHLSDYQIRTTRARYELIESFIGISGSWKKCRGSPGFTAAYLDLVEIDKMKWVIRGLSTANIPVPEPQSPASSTTNRLRRFRLDLKSPEIKHFERSFLYVILVKSTSLIRPAVGRHVGLQIIQGRPMNPTSASCTRNKATFFSSIIMLAKMPSLDIAALDLLHRSEGPFSSPQGSTAHHQRDFRG